MSLLLRGIEWWSDGRAGSGDLRVVRGRIAGISPSIRPRRGDVVVDLERAWVLPGLVNAHDHLGLDLLPALGDPPYASFYRWAEEIYRPQETPIVELERLAMRDRLAWGGWRNVLGGATTVAHHDPWHARTFRSSRFPVGVARCAWGHSLGFEEDLRGRYRRDRPFVVHAAEGTDERAHGEIAELDRLGLLRDNTIVVHAIALSAADIELLARRGSRVAWCPVSNLRLYGRTAPVAELRRAGVPVVLGTDSTLSGATTLLDELRAAAQTGAVTADELLAMVTGRTRDVLALRDGRGALVPGGRADLLVLPDRGTAAVSLLAARTPDLRLVLTGGRARLARPEVAEALGLGAANIGIEGERMWIDERFGDLRARLDSALGPRYPHGELWRRVD